LITSFPNLLTAHRRARSGKRDRNEVARFSLDLEPWLLRLQERLLDGSWAPGPYRQFTIYDRKPRLISAAPYADRVVHHALFAHVEPVLDARFHPDVFACRRGKGVHAAVDRYEGWSRRYGYVLQLDVRRYFESVRHDVLKAELRRHFREPPLLAVLDRVIDGFSGPAAGCGMPIGNLTSQLFANLYLNRVDHWIKGELRVPAYLRYVDDLVLLADDKGVLHEACSRIAERLAPLGLALREDRRHARRTSEKIALFGYQVSRTRRWLGAGNGARFERRLRALCRAYSASEIGFADVTAHVRSWEGHAVHGETQALRAAVFARNPLRRAGTEGVA
jgi:hypothetical protein